VAASTHDQDVFSFYPDGSFCNGFEDVLSRYREIVPHLRLAGYPFTKTFLFLGIFYLFMSLLKEHWCLLFSGPTSFGPIVEMAMTIVEQSGGQYHVLVIIADGQVFFQLDFLCNIYFIFNLSTIRTMLKYCL